MQKEEYLIKNACYSPAKYYLCKQNNKRSLLGRKQRSQVARSFPNRYQFSYINKVASLFSTSCILRIILHGHLPQSILPIIILEIMKCFGMKYVFYKINFGLKASYLATANNSSHDRK